MKTLITAALLSLVIGAATAFAQAPAAPSAPPVSRDNLDENGATIWMRRCGRERAHDCRRPQLWQGR